MTHLQIWRFGLLVGLTFVVASLPRVFAADSTDYRVRPDVIDSGGGDFAKSTNYLLSDSIGEAVVGHGQSTDYFLESGYRQPSAADFLSLSCGSSVAIGTFQGAGQKTGTGTCTVYTDAYNGYSLGWSVPTGSGGVNTGYLISQFNDTIAPFTPVTNNVPDTWSVAAADSEWGARLRSASTDTAAEWGTDNSSEKWLNVRTTNRIIVTRSSATLQAGSTESIQFRGEIGSSAFKPTGTYQATVVMTVVGL